MDIYIRPQDVRGVLEAFAKADFNVEITDRSWLAKIQYDGVVMDLIFAMSNQRVPVDDIFLQSKHNLVLNRVRGPLISLEHLIASKLYLVKSYRFDGADILHLIRSAEGRIDWDRLLDILQDHPELQQPLLDRKG